MNRKIDYEVGFGKPPKHSQFKKGQSGNPHGRPKKLPKLLDAFRDEAQNQVELRGKKITFQQALVGRLWHESLKGNLAAAKLVLRYMELDQNEAPEDFDPALDDEIELMKILRKAQRTEKEAS